jgi:hypothetical protein
LYSNAVLSSAFGEIIRLILLNWQTLPAARTASPEFRAPAARLA